MLLVKFISALKDISNARKSLQIGIKNNKNDCNILQKELNKIEKEIKNLKFKLKEEMRIKGFKSLKERIKLTIEDINQKENKEPIKIISKKKKIFTQNLNYDFRNYSTEFLLLNKEKNNKQENILYRDIDMSISYKKISFGENTIIIESLKEMYKKSKLNKNKTLPLLKPILKGIKKKKLKQIIKEEIKSKIKIIFRRND